jgi:hypothetical protein
LQRHQDSSPEPEWQPMSTLTHITINFKREIRPFNAESLA